MAITSHEVNNLLSYNPSNGYLIFRKTRRGGKRVGERAGCVNNHGYRQLKINYKLYKEHNIIWLMVNGNLPPDGFYIDHINGIKDDNRISNLRLCTHQQNCFNRGNGKNYYFNGNGYTVDFKIDGKSKNYGSFKTEEEAIMVAKQIRNELHGDFNRDLKGGVVA